MFHVSTLLPFDVADPQHLERKRWMTFSSFHPSLTISNHCLDTSGTMCVSLCSWIREINAQTNISLSIRLQSLHISFMCSLLFRWIGKRSRKRKNSLIWLFWFNWHFLLFALQLQREHMVWHPRCDQSWSATVWAVHKTGLAFLTLFHCSFTLMVLIDRCRSWRVRKQGSSCWPSWSMVRSPHSPLLSLWPHNAALALSSWQNWQR